MRSLRSSPSKFKSVSASYDHRGRCVDPWTYEKTVIGKFLGFMSVKKLWRTFRYICWTSKMRSLCQIISFFCSHVAKMFLYLNLNEKTQLKFLEQEMNGICFSPVSFMNLFFCWGKILCWIILTIGDLTNLWDFPCRGIWQLWSLPSGPLTIRFMNWTVNFFLKHSPPFIICCKV